MIFSEEKNVSSPKAWVLYDIDVYVSLFHFQLQPSHYEAECSLIILLIKGWKNFLSLGGKGG